MRKYFLSTIAIIPAVFLSSASAEGFYGSVKMQESRQNLAGGSLISARLDNPALRAGGNKDTTGAIALGYEFYGGWRLETEYNIKTDSKFKSPDSPLGATVSDMQVSSKRLMFNGYKGFAVTDAMSIYAMAGIGVANINSQGNLAADGDRLGNNTQNNLAYSVGVGADVKLNERITVGTGYRFVDMGNIQSGSNRFADRFSSHDEKLKGTLREHNLFLEARFAF